jgi:hypothetical protein
MNYPPPPPIPLFFPPAPPVTAPETALAAPCRPFDPPPAPPEPKRINSRAKGQRGEREIVRLLQCIVDKVLAGYRLPPILIERNQLQTNQGGHDLAGLPEFAIEVKFCETELLTQWWEQTLVQAAKHGGIPILLYRASRKPWRAKIRAFVNSPKERDQIEADIELSIEDFTSWFESAFDELIVERMHNLK